MKKILLFCSLFFLTANINAANYTVNSGNYYYSPQSLSINVGDTVNWINDGGYHNVNFDINTFSGSSFNNPFSFISAPTTDSAMYTHVFLLPGTYSYDCSVGQHAANGMTGIIVVNTITISPLLITEITDPQNSSTSGRYIEIYNSGNQDIDLSTGYALVRWTNASTSPQSSVGLTGIIPAGGFYVACNSGTKFLATYGVSESQDIGTGGPADSNGDDNIALLAPDGSIIDMFGVAGEDGSGTGHEFEDGRAERACSSTLPSATWQASDWNIDNDSGGGNGPQYAPADFDPFAWICITANVSGCTDTSAVNYTANATSDDGSCCFVSGCTDSSALNYDATVCYDDNSCVSFIYGCTDTSAVNYTANANTDDGSCCFLSGCTDSSAFNYDATYCYDDGSCIGLELGCTDILAMNFDSTANTSNGSCIFLADKIDLFFSEYGEGSSNNKYIEIYNSTANSVDLSSYGITRVSNAPTTVGVYEYWVDFDSAAVILANDVYVICHPSADSIILAQADMTYSVLSNGDDGFALVYGGKPSSPVLPGNEYIILDFLGDFNGDPGSGWDVAGVTEATYDHTLVRKCAVTQGNTDWISSAGTDSLNSEWIVSANEDWTDLGVHTNPCQSVDVYGCTNSTAYNYDPSATIDDGSCTYDIFGCTGPSYCNYDSLATMDDGSCTGMFGCMDPLYNEYSPAATCDDGSCTYASICTPVPVTGVVMSDVIHNRATFNWDNMNSTTCSVDQMVIRYREVGSSSWTQKFLGQPTGSTIYYGTDKRVLGLTPSTTYEYGFKIWYAGVSNPVNWAANPSGTFTTLGSCPNVGNLVVTTGSTTQATFTWDASNGAYSFVRIKMRPDTTNGAWVNVGGFGTSYPLVTKNKNGLTPGQSYRGQSKTWCDPTGGPYKADSWTSLIFWTQPTSVRLEGGTSINNLSIYPNPSRDIFNISFTSDTKQNLSVRILNVIGEELINENLEQFVGEYTKQINLSDNAKGVYFLEITTNNGVVNKKLILQ